MLAFLVAEICDGHVDDDFHFFAAGRDLLVHPVTEEGAKGVTAYLPGKDVVEEIHFLHFSVCLLSLMSM